MVIRQPKFYQFTLLIFSCCVLVAHSKVETKANLPFRPGEKLIYKIKWGYIPAGDVIFEVKSMKEIDSTMCYHFSMTVTTNAFVNKFYKVEDQIDAFADEEMHQSILYKKKQREGTHVRDVVLKFDWDKKEVQYFNFGKSKSPVTLVDGTFDPLSIFYKLRCHEFTSGKEYSIPVTDGKKNIDGKIKVVEKQFIKTKLGKMRCWLIEPELKQLRGVFKKSKRAKFKVWFSTDSRVIPMKFSSKVVVGSFTGELVAIE